ncbi:1,5-anhydro-D-fructose reductase-like [Uloborus diversus]|uniref:1,5-anhydro-D-fructose reductase-like n=1 Tax=Uloborus diversus TaxID=327109 RepID=UPI00240A690C|nr:1,5-anhydro-D-fructose reductase-like [Uloborus diversus]
MAAFNYIEFSDGNKMPIIGYGTSLADKEDSLIPAVEAAVDAGYRHIDTAFLYKNEPIIGKALQKIFSKGVVERKDLFITTKLPVNGFKEVKYFCQKSLSNLQLSYVDLYLIHCPMASKRTELDEEVYTVDETGTYQGDYTIDLVTTWKAMEELVDEGLVKSIGLSNFNSLQIQRIYDNARIKPANLQVECHAYLPQYELHDFCKKLNISFTSYGSLASPGFVEYMVNAGMGSQKERLLDDEKLKPICAKHGKTPAQVLLRYLVQRDIAVIPKSIKPERIKENIQIFDFQLDEEDNSILRAMPKNLRIFDFDFLKGMKDHPEYPFNIPF